MKARLQDEGFCTSNLNQWSVLCTSRDTREMLTKDITVAAHSNSRLINSTTITFDCIIEWFQGIWYPQ
jgi:hypothetical protein